MRDLLEQIRTATDAEGHAGRILVHVSVWLIAAASIWSRSLWLGLEGRRRWALWGLWPEPSNADLHDALVALRGDLRLLTVITALAAVFLAILLFRLERRPLRWVTLLAALLAVVMFLLGHISVAFA